MKVTSLNFPNNRLRVGFLIESWTVPSWIGSVATEVAASNSAEIAAVVVDRGAGDGDHLMLHQNSRPNPLSFAQLYLHFDYCIFHPSPDALAPIDLKNCAKESCILETTFLFTGHHFALNESDLKRLEQINLDVILLFCFGFPSEQVLSLAKYGAWFFLDHELRSNGYSPVGFWEVLKQQRTTMHSLKAQLAGASGPIELHRYYGPTDLRSIAKTRNNLLWKSGSIVTRKLERLSQSGALDDITSSQGQSIDNAPAKVPSNLTVVMPVLSHVSRFLRDKIKERRYFEQWIIGYSFANTCDLFDRDFTNYRWLVPPKDRCWADPFPVEMKDSYYLFFEEKVFSENKGYLCAAPIDEEGFRDQPKIILKHDYHISYPFVFSWEGDWYLIPETQAAKRIDVYKFDSFPYKVSFYKTLMENVKAVDTTLFEADEHWWMFVSIAPQGTWNVDELFLFYARSPFGPWVSHPNNPIKSDVRCARPAGRIFTRGKKNYRPAQDCSHGYGYAIRLQEIKALSESIYVEQESEAILPSWAPNFIGIHTLNSATSLTTIDAVRLRSR